MHVKLRIRSAEDPAEMVILEDAVEWNVDVGNSFRLKMWKKCARRQFLGWNVSTPNVGNEKLQFYLVNLCGKYPVSGNPIPLRGAIKRKLEVEEEPIFIAVEWKVPGLRSPQVTCMKI